MSEQINAKKIKRGHRTVNRGYLYLVGFGEFFMSLSLTIFFKHAFCNKGWEACCLPLADRARKSSYMDMSIALILHLCPPHQQVQPRKGTNETLAY